jgi:two-component system NarL family sensor kinase
LQRVAAELHDGPVQWMVGAKMQVETLRGALERGEPIEAERLDLLQQLIARAVGDSRRLMRGLLIDTETETPWQRQLASELREVAAVVPAPAPQLLLELPESLPNLSAEAALAVRRAAREACWNALRHSGAAKVRCTASVTPVGLELEIRDDGRGMDPAATGGEPHRGLQLIRDRLAAVGGRATLESTVGSGTCWRLRLPATE